MTDLAGVKVVVTGATSGLGAAMADALLQAGATVAMAARPTPRLEEAVAARNGDGLAAQALPMDVRDPASISAASRGLLERWGRVDLIETLHLDRGYASDLTRQRCIERMLPDVVIAKKRKRGTAKGKNPQPMGLR
ncbi:MAG: SDR family NAD(P)-dependent oxidoreductase [Acidimicrobiales bacterium]